MLHEQLLKSFFSSEKWALKKNVICFVKGPCVFVLALIIIHTLMWKRTGGCLILLELYVVGTDFDLNFRVLHMTHTHLLLFEWHFTAVYWRKQHEMFSALCVGLGVTNSHLYARAITGHISTLAKPQVLRPTIDVVNSVLFTPLNMPSSSNFSLFNLHSFIANWLFQISLFKSWFGAF